MKHTLACAKCGTANEFGHIFCTKCGAKLDMSHVPVARGSSIEWARLLVGGLRLAVFLVVLAGAGLIIWPVTPAGKQGGDKDAAAWLAQRAALKDGAQQGQAAKAVASEVTLNAYLAASLKLAQSNDEATASWKMTLDEVNLALLKELVTVTTVAHVGPISLTWEICGAPKVTEGPFALDVRSGRVGHLQLPRAGAEWLALRMAVLFHRWQPERELLDQLGSMVVEPGQVTFAVRPGGAQKPAAEK